MLLDTGTETLWLREIKTKKPEFQIPGEVRQLPHLGGGTKKEEYENITSLYYQLSLVIDDFADRFQENEF